MLFSSSIHAAVSKPTLPLSLLEAERLAIEKDAGTPAISTNTNPTVANPQLSVGIEDTPAAISPLSKDEATMVKIGVKQGFLLGQSPELAAQRWGAVTTADEKADKDSLQSLLQKLRQAWLDVYLWQHSVNTIETLQPQLRAKSGIKNKLPLSKLALQQRQALKKLKTARTKLTTLIGYTDAMRPMPIALPAWPAPPPLKIMQSQLAQHPKLQSNAARITADRVGLQQNKQLNKTAVNVGMNYGIRHEDDTGDTRPDMVGMELQFKLPSSGQSNNKANREQLTQAMLAQQLNYRELSRQLRKKYGAWQTLATKNNAPATFLATDRVNSVTNLTTYLTTLSNQVALAKARVDLLYFETD